MKYFVCLFFLHTRTGTQHSKVTLSAVSCNTDLFKQ